MGWRTIALLVALGTLTLVAVERMRRPREAVALEREVARQLDGMREYLFGR